MTPIELTALPDGSLRLKGDGGCSAGEPSCDGSHAQTGWKEDA